jgi:hypothetical protein
MADTLNSTILYKALHTELSGLTSPQLCLFSNNPTIDKDFTSFSPTEITDTSWYARQSITFGVPIYNGSDTISLNVPDVQFQGAAGATGQTVTGYWIQSTSMSVTTIVQAGMLASPVQINGAENGFIVSPNTTVSVVTPAS